MVPVSLRITLWNLSLRRKRHNMGETQVCLPRHSWQQVNTKTKNKSGSPMNLPGERVRKNPIFLKTYGDRILWSEIHAFCLHSRLHLCKCAQSCRHHAIRGQTFLTSHISLQLIPLFHPTLGKHRSGFNPHGQNTNGFRQPFMSGGFHGFEVCVLILKPLNVYIQCWHICYTHRMLTSISTLALSLGYA